MNSKPTRKAKVAPRPASWAERHLGDPDGKPDGRNLVAFRFVVLVAAAVQSWSWVVSPLNGEVFPRAPLIGASLALSLGAALGLTRLGRHACIGMLPILFWEVSRTFPATPNHVFLMFVLVAVFALLEPERDEERQLLTHGLRWMAAVLFFYSGLQKALYGYYFQGEFLSWMVAHGTESWSQLFGLFLPADEIARLQGLSGATGSGPYRSDSLGMLVVSNGVWIGECLIGLLLLVPRTRVVAALAAIALVFTIQAAPHEFVFALLFSFMMMLWLPWNLNWRLAPVWAFAFLYLLAVLGGVAPGEWLLKANGRI